jgi:ubiquinol-cytochrome c reductase cytochrome c1 subunit
MRRLAFLAALLAASPVAAQPSATPPAAEAPELPTQKWSFDGLFGTYDLASAQRGFQVYSQVCSNCHSMNLVHYRDLTGIGLSADQIKAVAAAVTVPGGINDQGDAFTRPGLPSDVFRAPYANVKAAAAANGGKAPPDQSLLVNAREGGPDYIYALLNGYSDPPKGVTVPDGLYYNDWYPGHLIHMPAPLAEGAVTYADGTKATVPQMARDVTTFLAWTSNPELVQRKRMGVRWVLIFGFMAGVTYVVKRQIWAGVH